MFTLKERKTPAIVPALGLLLAFLSIFLRSAPIRAEAFNPQDNRADQPAEQQLNVWVNFESNRTLGEKETYRAVYQWLGEHYRFQTGTALDCSEGTISALFIDVGYARIKDSDFGINLKFLGNQYSAYEKAANSVIAYLNWEHAGFYADLGMNRRCLNSNPSQLWNIFYYDPNIVEWISYYRLGTRFTFPDPRFQTVLEFNNCDPMYAGNLGAYGFFVTGRFRPNPRTAFWGIWGFRQSGSIALAATYYSTSLSLGMEVSF